MKTIWLGCGCFWSTADAYARLDGVVATEVGFVHQPGFAPCEVARVQFSPQTVSLRALFDRFFLLHDPTDDLADDDEPGARSLVGAQSAADAQVAREALDAAMSAGRFAGSPLTAFVVKPAYVRADERFQSGRPD